MGESFGDLLSAFLRGELEQQLGDPPVDIEQNQRPDLLVGTTEPFGEHPEQRDADFRRSAQPGMHILTAQGMQIYWSPYYKVSYAPEYKIISTNDIGHQNMVAVGQVGPA